MNRVAMFLVFFGGLSLAGCASNSGVRPIGPDTFMVSRQAATGFSGLGTLKADALDEAKRYCAGQKKELQVVSTNESKPPYLLGNFPRAEVQFMCLNSTDPELARPKLQPQPDVAIQVGTEPPASAPINKVGLVPVSIESEPAGADVFLDGAFVGSTPLPNYGIAAGEHVLEISRTGFAKWNRKLLVTMGVPTRVRATLEPATATQPPNR